MAVEAGRLSLFPPQFLTNREVMNGIESNGNIYGGGIPIGFGVPPLSAITTTETLLPMYGSVTSDLIMENTAMKADSGLTYTLPISRKRSRDSINPLLSFPNNPNHDNRCGSFTFLGEDVSLQIQQQQLDIDLFITHHMEKVKMDIEERRRIYSRRIVAAMEEGIAKKLRYKEEEISQIAKLNWGLEERVKSLCLENQIWRDLAQSNEATANALRINLEHVLAQVNCGGGGLEQALMDDAQSCCGSNFVDDGRTVEESGGEREVVKCNGVTDDCTGGTSNGLNDSKVKRGGCRNCGREESCVLLLPCRHLCLCTMCGSSVQTCPICKTTKSASLHVKLSPHE